MKIMIIYDSITGNTEKMAHAIAEGAGSVAGAVVEVKKIGEPFPLSMVEKADGVLLGSPCIYANVTEGMRGFLDNMEAYAKSGKINVKGHPATIFGSYGWDGAWVMEELLKKTVQGMGFKVKDEVCVEEANNIKYQADQHLEKCKAFGKEFVESVKA